MIQRLGPIIKKYSVKILTYQSIEHVRSIYGINKWIICITASIEIHYKSSQILEK